jgi:DNA-binding NarL/FixJ family response regulator
MSPRLHDVPLRVAAVEDNGRYRASLETLLSHAPGFQLIGTFDAAPPALAALTGAALPWDLIVMDLELPGMSGVEAIRRVKEVSPRTAIVVLTVFEDPATVLEAICSGADGYLLKRTPAEQLLAELRSIVEGHSPLSSAVARTVLEFVRQAGGPTTTAPPGPSRLDLSDREQEVLRCLVDGLGYKQTAERLEVSLDTVRTYIRRIYGKLQVHSVAEAVSRAVRERLV